jgi:hypothetical protein
MARSTLDEGAGFPGTIGNCVGKLEIDEGFLPIFDFQLTIYNAPGL